MAHVNEGLMYITQFCLPPCSATFIHKWNEPPTAVVGAMQLPLLPAAEPHRTLAGSHFRPNEGRRVSLPGWLDEILRWFARPKTVTHRIVLAAAAGNPTCDHRVASPTP